MFSHVQIKQDRSVPRRSMFNVQRSTFKGVKPRGATPLYGVQGLPQQNALGCWLFDVRCSMFDVRCSRLNAQRSTFNAQRSTFNAQDLPQKNARDAAGIALPGSLSSLRCNSPRSILRRKIQPRNTLNTRKPDSTLLFLSRISRIPRLPHCSFWCGCAALRSFAAIVSPVAPILRSLFDVRCSMFDVPGLRRAQSSRSTLHAPRTTHHRIISISAKS